MVSTGKLYSDEYAQNLLELACTCDTPSDQVCSIAWLVPKDAEQALNDEIAKVLSPSFRFRDLQYGGPGPSTEERERTRKDYEDRVVAFATQLRNFRLES